MTPAATQPATGTGGAPQVAKPLRICRLNQRPPVFATVDDALANLTATASACTC